MKCNQYPVTLHYADHAFEPPIGTASDLVESLELPEWVADMLIAIYSICNGSRDGIPDGESGITLWDVEKVTQVHKSACEDTLRLGDWMLDADFVAIRKSDPSAGVF
jgi:hypothetical protein